MNTCFEVHQPDRCGQAPVSPQTIASEGRNEDFGIQQHVSSVGHQIESERDAIAAGQGGEGMRSKQGGEGLLNQEVQTASAEDLDEQRHHNEVAALLGKRGQDVWTDVQSHSHTELHGVEAEPTSTVVRSGRVVNWADAHEEEE